MRRTVKIFLIAIFLLFHVTSAFAKLADPSGVFALFEDAKFGMYADYEYYGKHFNDRDINKYNGNNYTDPDTGEEVEFTDEIETFQWHELKLYPKIVFNSRLEFHMRLDMGDYIFSEDMKNRIDLEESGDVTRVIEDREKITVQSIALEMVTPVGLFLMGRLSDGKHGVIYGIQLPNLPTWTFAFAWLKKREGKVDYYDKAQSSEDKDDQNEAALISIYNDAEGFTSRQWLEARFARGESQSVKNQRIWIPQWEAEYQKNRLHVWGWLAFGWGTAMELSRMSLADSIDGLARVGNTLALFDDDVRFPDLQAKDVDIPLTVPHAFAVSYRIGGFEPGFGFQNSFGDGAENWYEVGSLLWDRFEREGYPRDGRFKTLLTKEIEDRYFPTISSIGSALVFTPDTIYSSNLSSVHVRCWYDFSEKLEMFNQITGNWRTNTEFYKKNYWDQFPLRYALRNGTDEAIPVVLMYEDVDYYLDSVDPFIGWEFNGHLTYHLFDGLDVSLLYSYFGAGKFYEQVLEPKPYSVVWIDTATSSVAEAGTITGPYTYADDFQLSNAWSVQFKVDFRFEI